MEGVHDGETTSRLKDLNIMAASVCDSFVHQQSSTESTEIWPVSRKTSLTSDEAT